MFKFLMSLFIILTGTNSIAQNNISQLDWPNLTKYEKSNEAVKLSAMRKKKVVFMGDSITEFWNNFDSVFADKPYINRGISGQTTPQMLARFRADVIALKPAVVVLLAGINDIAENTGPISVENIYGNIISMIQLAKANNIKPIICSVLPANQFNWRPQINPAFKVIELNKLLLQYCKQHNITYVDYYTKMVDDQMGLDKKFTNDGVHPIAAGYQFMEPIIVAAINKLLNK